MFVYNHLNSANKISCKGGDCMRLKIVNMRKFFRTITLIILAIMCLLFIGFNNSYSKTETKYKEEYAREGDTLWSIVENEYNKNAYFKDKDIREVIQEIKAINNMQYSNLKICQRILIPNI